MDNLVQKRGVGKGSNFMVLSREAYDGLWSSGVKGRSNLLLTFLVLLSGTGSDHRFTKWSASACEEHVGIGRPRAKLAISELIEMGMLRLAEGGSRLRPQYEILCAPTRDEDVIFLPNQIVTGFRGEASLLRRVKEVGDPLLLRMLIDLYDGIYDLDATQGLPISWLRSGESEGGPVAVSKMGSNTVWAIDRQLGSMTAGGDWRKLHHKPRADDPWGELWARVQFLKRIGAIWFEPWIFIGGENDPEPFMPVDLAYTYDGIGADEVTNLTMKMRAVAEGLLLEKEYLLEKHDDDLLLTLPSHFAAPQLIGVARLKIEPDTPGFRRAYGSRMRLVEARLDSLDALQSAIAEGDFGRPLGAPYRRVSL